MKSKILKNIVLTIAIMLGLSFIAPATYATDVCSSDAAPEVKKAAGCSGNTDALPEILITILNSIIAIAGLIAVIYVIIGGVNYMTSAGDANKLEKARKTILYAVIGLVICALAFVIVNFVINHFIG